MLKIWFWVCILLWIIYGGWVGINHGTLMSIGGTVIPFLCVVFLGLKVFDSPLQ